MESHIVICPNQACKVKLRLPKGRGRLSVTCPNCKGKFLFDSNSGCFDFSQRSGCAPDNMSSLEVQAKRHAEQVINLSGKYLTEHSEDAAEALECLYSKTTEYYQQRCDGYDGVLAVHAHILALWNVNERFCPDEALDYAHTADKCYREYLDSEAVRSDPIQQQKTMVYLKNVWLVCAYIEYSNDNLHGALDLLQKGSAEESSVTDIALAASILLRLTTDEGIDGFKNAFLLFQEMDRRFIETPLHLFEEDIIRIAYGFYELYYTHGIYNEEYPIPYDPGQAVSILTRACALITDPQQKEFMKRDIESAREMLNRR